MAFTEGNDMAPGEWSETESSSFAFEQENMLTVHKCV